MRALIVSLAAVGFAISSLSGYAREPSQVRLEQPGRTADDEPNLKSAGASHRAGRAIDEDAPLKSAGAAARLNRAADDESQPLKSAGVSHRAARAVDEDAPLKSASVAEWLVRAPVMAKRRIASDATTTASSTRFRASA